MTTADEMKPGDNRLRGIDPEKLLLVELDEIAPLLEVQYPSLPLRAEELLAKAVEWAKEHHNGTTHVITDDADQNSASDLYRMLLSFAGDSGEVEETRDKVSKPVFRAKQAIDAWFKTQRERLVGAMVVIDKAQNARADLKRREEAAERARLAKLAEETAAKALAAAQVANAPVDVVETAIEAEVAAAEAQAAAAAPAVDLTRTRSALGVTTSQSERWDYRVEDLKALCAAVVAGTAPITFIQVNDAAIKQAIKGKNGMRTVPGLEIFPDYKLNRRGAK